MDHVAPLSDLDRTAIASAGGKGANLGELVRAGLPVPDGFVVTTAAYADAAAAVDLPVDGDGEAVRDRIATAPVPAALRAEIARGYAGLGGGPVAVRSSATAEDLPGAAFAGQQDTYLGVVGEDAVLAAVRRCWASLWTDRAIAYRARLGIDPAEVAIAVVVQRMVDAEVAGVLFTADPLTGDRDVLVLDASPGLGEAVVSGRVTPDHYVLKADGAVRVFTPGRREVVLRAAAGGGVHRATGEPRTGERLPEPVLAELARLGTAVAAHFGRPQDVEWALADGHVQLVQARPMTALPPPPVRLNAAQRALGSVLLDYLPVRPYPMDMSSWVPYGPVGMMARIAAEFGIRGAFSGALQEDETGVVDRMAPATPRPSPGVLRAPARLLSRARRYDPARWTADPRFVRFRARVREVAAEDPATLPWSRLVGLPRRAMDLIGPIGDLRLDYLPRTGLSLLRLAVLLAVLRRRDRLADLVAGAPTRTTDANRAMEHLAARARSDPRLRAAVDRLDPSALAGFPEFRAEFDAFLAEYGHRETVSPVLVSTPTLGEAPEAALGTLKVLAAAPPGPAGGPGDALAELLEHPLLHGRRRARVRRWVEQARAGVAFREDSHFYFLMPLPLLRRALLEIGRRLRDTGVLDRPDDVFHLRLEEVESVDDPAGTLAWSLRAVARSRAARRAELAGVRLIDPATVFPRRDRGRGTPALVAGTPASSGMATGPVRVIREPAEFGRLTAGDVLVCPYTNPAWTPLFQRAAAVVVDSGGAASHAAIVAREYGIPAVMGTGNGTGTLVDGRRVTVDGNAGRVTGADAG